MSCQVLLLLLLLSSVVIITAGIIKYEPEKNTEEERNHSVLVVFADGDEFLDALEMCESGGNSDAVVLDVNNKLSIGAFQFQGDTMKLFFRDVVKTEISDEQYEAIAKSPLAREIAKIMIANNWKGGTDHWKNCTIKITGGV